MKRMRFQTHPLSFYTHACMPKAVAIAVSNVMVIFRIFVQMLLVFSIVFLSYELFYPPYEGGQGDVSLALLNIMLMNYAESTSPSPLQRGI